MITGASGFVGPHLAQHLASLDYDVWGASPKGSVAAAYRPIALDVRRSREVLRVIGELAPDEVYHLAGVTRPASDNVSAFYDVNLYGTLHVLEAAKAVGARVLVVSSAYVYGRHDRAMTETTPLEPVNHYGASKAAGDLASIGYALNGLPVVRVRPFNHTGPGQSPDFVLPSLVQQLARIEAGLKSPIIELGNLDSVRDFSDVRDIVRAYPLLLDKGRTGDVYNLSTGQGTSIRELVGQLTALTDIPVKLVAEAARVRATDIPFLVGDASKLRELGWEPKCSLERTLLDMLMFERERLQS